MSADFLFAYGTLLSADTGSKGRSQRERLARECRVIGAATMPGRLYNLGLYPALVEAVDDPLAIVRGEVVELADAARSFKWLDAYEGIVPGQHASNQYERVRRSATFEDGATVEAWVYLWRAALSKSARLISGGDWLKR